MKTLTAFIIGTSAGIYLIITEGKTDEHYYFLWAITVLAVFAMGTFVALLVYLDRNID